jgi:hypothetical protein
LRVIASEAKHPLKGPCQEEKSLLSASFLILFHSTHYDKLNQGENVTFAIAEISARTMSAPFGTFAAPSTHQDLGQGMGFLFVFLPRL